MSTPASTARATCAVTDTSARTGTPSTASTSAAVSARPSSTTNTTADGRTGATTARRSARKHGRVSRAAIPWPTRPRRTRDRHPTRGRRRPPPAADRRRAARPARALVPRPMARDRGATTRARDRLSISRRANPSAGTSGPSRSQSLTPAASGSSGRPATASASPARSTSNAPPGAARAMTNASAVATTVVPAPPLADQQHTTT